MKKVSLSIICLLAVFCLWSCGAEESESGGYEIAMVTTSEAISIDDSSSNEATWEGIRAYAEEHELTYKYYEPAEESTDARLEQIDEAVSGGASVIVVCGPEFNEVIATAKDKYSDKDFVLIDGEVEEADNVVTVDFKAQEAGYLAGYAAVYDGYRNLGFLGRSRNLTIKDFGYGFIKGANDAADDIGAWVEINYNYRGPQRDSASIRKKAASWYNSGTEIIFACGDDVFDAVNQAATSGSGRMVMGSGTSKNAVSNRVVTSAIYDYGVATKSALEAAYSAEREGATTLSIGAAEDAVALAMSSARFDRFRQANYNTVYDRLKDGKVDVPDNSDGEKVTTIISKKKLRYVDVTIA